MMPNRPKSLPLVSPFALALPFSAFSFFLLFLSRSLELRRFLLRLLRLPSFLLLLLRLKERLRCAGCGGGIIWLYMVQPHEHTCTHARACVHVCSCGCCAKLLLLRLEKRVRLPCMAHARV